VQAYFPSYGWVNFDPTPLGDGRQQPPGYLNNGANASQGSSAGRQNPDRQPVTTPTPPAANKPIPSPTGDTGTINSTARPPAGLAVRAGGAARPDRSGKHCHDPPHVARGRAGRAALARAGGG